MNGFFAVTLTTVTADHREALQTLRPYPHFPIADSPCFHSHSLWSGSLRCQLVSSILNQVLPSRFRTSIRSAATSQSPELGDFCKLPIPMPPRSSLLVQPD